MGPAVQAYPSFTERTHSPERDVQSNDSNAHARLQKYEVTDSGSGRSNSSPESGSSETPFFQNSRYDESDESTHKAEGGYKVRCLAFGVLNVIWIGILAYLCHSLLAAPSCERMAKSASEEPFCFPCKTLPPGLRQSQDWCCAQNAAQLQLFMDSFANTKMSEMYPRKGSTGAPNVHVKIDSSKSTAAMKSRDGYLPLASSSDSTNPLIACQSSCLRAPEDGAYFVYAHMVFNFTRDGCSNMTFSVQYEDSETKTVSEVFKSHIPCCSCNSGKRRVVPGVVGGIKRMKKGDSVYVKTSHPELLSPRNNQFGFHAL